MYFYKQGIEEKETIIRPLFSIIITTYNRPKALMRAIESVTGQKETSYELIIVNDGSTADYSEIEGYCKTRSEIRYFYKENEERSVARNYGVDNAIGRFICFLDDDDYYLSNHLLTLKSEILSKPAIDFFFTGSYLIDSNNQTKKPLITDEIDIKKMINKVLYEHIWLCTACIRKEVFEVVKFLPSINIWEDQNLFLKILVRYEFFEIPEYTTVVVNHNERSTKDSFRKYEVAKLRPFILAVKDLFNDNLFSRHVNNKQKTDFLFNKVKVFLLNACWLRNKTAIQYFTFELVKIDWFRLLTDLEIIKTIVSTLLLNTKRKEEILNV